MLKFDAVALKTAPAETNLSRGESFIIVVQTNYSSAGFIKL